MNDFLRMLPSYRRPGTSLLQVSRELAKAPCGPLGMRSPDDVAPELLRRRGLRLA